jgi:uncharacterized protein YraI
MNWTQTSYVGVEWWAFANRVTNFGSHKSRKFCDKLRNYQFRNENSVPVNGPNIFLRTLW